MTHDAAAATATPVPTRFDAVLFDCDGVLVDSEPLTQGVLRAMLGELGWQLSIGECTTRFIGKALKDELGVIAEHTGVTVGDEWIAEFRARRNTEIEKHLTPVRGSVEAVRAISERYGSRIAVASGADRAKVELQLGKVGLARFFGDHLFSGMETERSKPAPDVYLLAAATLGVRPDHCVVVEDTPTGVRAGVAAGATVVGYAEAGVRSAAAAELRAVGASVVIDDLADLGELV